MIPNGQNLLMKLGISEINIRIYKKEILPNKWFCWYLLKLVDARKEVALMPRKK